MSIITITKAVRKGAHVIIGLYGESGSGKTYSAIHLARGLVGKDGRFGLLDTETGRGLIYSDMAGGFDYAELTPPFTPERYKSAIQEFEASGIQALIIDSASHEWEGIGGVIEIADASGYKGLLKWASPKMRHKAFVQAMLRSRIHLILCLRAKEKMVEAIVDGKKTIISAGLVSVQDKRFIYEMTVQCRLINEPGKRGHFVLEKCPEDLLPAFPAGKPISIVTGEHIAKWVGGGAPLDAALEALKRSGEDAASGGMAVLGKWFKSLDRADQARVKPYLDGNLKDIAETSDREAIIADLDDGAGETPGPDPVETETIDAVTGEIIDNAARAKSFIASMIALIGKDQTSIAIDAADARVKASFDRLNTPSAYRQEWTTAVLQHRKAIITSKGAY